MGDRESAARMESMENTATIKSRIVESVIQDIVNGIYESDSVITEKELVEKYHVSKSPVRDALMELCANEVLKNIPRYGYQIIRIGRDRMHEMMEFRYILETQCLRKSVRYVTRENIEELERLEREVQKDILNNPDYPITAHWKNNMEFHLLLASIARNQYIYRELQHTMNIQLRGYAQYFSKHEQLQRNTLNSTSHTKIIEGLKKGNAEEAVEGLREDLSKIDLYNQYSLFEP